MSKRHKLVKIVSGGAIVALLAYGGWSVKALVEENQELHENKKAVESQLSESNTELESLKDQFETIQNLLTEVTSAYEESEKTNVDLEKTIEDLNGQLNSLKEQINSLTNENKKLKEEVALKKARQQQSQQSTTQVASSGEADASSLVSRGTTESARNVIMMEATAYTAYCAGCSGTTATGIDLRANPSLKMIAVDPSVIPLGTKVHVEGYGYAIAGDTGGAIKGKKIDVFIPSKEEAYKWGRRTVAVTILN